MPPRYLARSIPTETIVTHRAKMRKPRRAVDRAKRTRRCHEAYTVVHRSAVSARMGFRDDEMLSAAVRCLSANTLPLDMRREAHDRYQSAAERRSRRSTNEKSTRPTAGCSAYCAKTTRLLLLEFANVAHERPPLLWGEELTEGGHIGKVVRVLHLVLWRGIAVRQDPVEFSIGT